MRARDVGEEEERGEMKRSVVRALVEERRRKKRERERERASMVTPVGEVYVVDVWMFDI